MEVSEQELRDKIKEVDDQLKRNIEENAMLHKERAMYKRELWELRDSKIKTPN